MLTLRLARNPARFTFRRPRHYWSFSPINPESRRSRLWVPLSVVAVGLVAFGYEQYRSSRPRVLETYQFVPTTVQDVEEYGQSFKLLSLQIPRDSIPEDVSFNPIWSIGVKDDDIQVERSYTPLDGISSSGVIKLWVKRYQGGEVGRWIHSKPLGDTIEIRGPIQTVPTEVLLGDWDAIFMISGGTGITPFYQLLQSTLSRRSAALRPDTRLLLLHSSRASELPPSSIMQDLHSWSTDSRLSHKLFITQGSPPPSFKTVSRRVDVSDIKEELKLAGLDLSRTLFLVSGPESLVRTLAGPRKVDQAQGPVGGVLGSLGCRPEQVWRL